MKTMRSFLMLPSRRIIGGMWKNPVSFRPTSTLRWRRCTDRKQPTLRNSTSSLGPKELDRVPAVASVRRVELLPEIRTGCAVKLDFEPSSNPHARFPGERAKAKIREAGRLIPLSDDLEVSSSGSFPAQRARAVRPLRFSGRRPDEGGRKSSKLVPFPGQEESVVGVGGYRGPRTGNFYAKYEPIWGRPPAAVPSQSAGGRRTVAVSRPMRKRRGLPRSQQRGGRKQRSSMDSVNCRYGAPPLLSIADWREKWRTLVRVTLGYGGRNRSWRGWR